MSRVVATLSDSRSSVAISSTVGKAENSSGRWIHSDTIRMSTENAIENARPMSIRIAGRGRNRTVRMTIMPAAKPISATLLRSTLPGMAATVAIGVLDPETWTRRLADQACVEVAKRRAGTPSGDRGAAQLKPRIRSEF